MKHTEFVRWYEVDVYYCSRCKKEYEGEPESCPKCDKNLKPSDNSSFIQDCNVDVYCDNCKKITNHLVKKVEFICEQCSPK